VSQRTPFEDLVAIMARLRGPDGCPWDREQTLETLRGYLLEETYELLEALDSGDPAHIREELGDVLLEVVFIAQVCSEQGHFGIDEVAGGIAAKLRRRHPHVFGERRADSSGEALKRWEEIKNAEKPPSPHRSLLDGVPRNMPALLRAHRLSTKASLAGFDWDALEGLYEKLIEELGEFREAAATGDREGMDEELGDLLFIAANIGRFAGIDPEMALHAANRKFMSRFAHIEAELQRRGKTPAEADMAELEELWERAKAAERA